MADEAAIDPEALDRLREWGGDKLLGQMLRLFLENSGKRMAQIRRGLDGGPLEEAEKGAHSLKSSAANVGAMDVRTVAAELEEMARAGGEDEARGLLPDLERAYESARHELEAIERGLNA